MTRITQYTVGMSNVFLLEGTKTVLVDTGSSGGEEAFLKVCNRHGIRPTDISLIIISHGHVDHYANAQAVKTLTGAPLMVHKLAVDVLRFAQRPQMFPRNELGEKIWADTLEDDPVPVVYPVEPDIAVEGEMDLHPYGIDAVMVPMPGHSDCSCSIFLDSGEAVVGDLVLDCPLDSSPQIAWFANDVAALKKSVELVLERAKVIYSGHGGPYTRDEVKALYDRETW